MDWPQVPAREEVAEWLEKTVPRIDGRVHPADYVAWMNFLERTDRKTGRKVFGPYFPCDAVVMMSEDEAAFAKFDATKMVREVEVVHRDDKWLTVRAVVTNTRGTSVQLATASVQATRGVDVTNPVENACTSALRRALVMQGFGLMPETGIASGEDIDEARAREEAGLAPGEAAEAAPPRAVKHCEKCDVPLSDRVAGYSAEHFDGHLYCYDHQQEARAARQA